MGILGATMRRRDGTPIWITRRSSEARALSRADFRPSAASGAYDEAWLQRFLQENPHALPVEQIEPGFGKLIPICRELPLTMGGGRSGALDNFFVTADGGLFLVEAKLWRNPESRRSVVAQAMEYAATVFQLSYEELQGAAKRARSASGQPAQSLFEIVASEAENVDEAEFIDAVSRNLRRGRAIVAVVGDGIREDIKPLADLLQSHAGHRFTFSLVEFGIYETPLQDVSIVIPSVLAQTALIERGVIQIEDGASGGPRIIVREPTAPATSASRERAIGIGEDEFYELLEQSVPGASARLKSFLEKAELLGIFVDRKGGLNLKHAAPSGNPLNVGTIQKNGVIDTGPSTWWGRGRFGKRYNEELARLIGGIVVESKTGESGLRTAAGRMPRVPDLLPAHEETWLRAIEGYIREVSEATEAN